MFGNLQPVKSIDYLHDLLSVVHANLIEMHFNLLLRFLLMLTTHSLIFTDLDTFVKYTHFYRKNHLVF